MCGIVGYVGEQPALDVVMQGLRRLEYRGYDSAGVAILDGGALSVERRAGKLANLDAAIAESNLPGSLGIGHTRWATHGAPTDRNAHPHTDCNGAVAIVHNGTIENFAELREGVEARGHVLRGETDTEAVAHLIEERYADSNGDLAAAVRAICRELEGSFVLVVAHRDRRRARGGAPPPSPRGPGGLFGPRRPPPPPPPPRGGPPPQPAAGRRGGRRRELPRQ